MNIVIIYVIIYSIVLIIINEYSNKKLKIREHQKILQEKIKNLNNLDQEELIHLYRTQMKKMQISWLISIILFAIYFTSLQPFEQVKIANNSTTIFIRNPILKSATFFVQAGNFSKMVKAESGILTLPITEKPKLSVVVLTFPFNIPILNRNWLGIIGSLILFLAIFNLILSVVKVLIRFFKLEIKNG